MRVKRYELVVDPSGSSELETLLACMYDGTREWRENLEEPSIEALTWQPYPNGPSIGGLILHMASCEAHWLQHFVGGIELDQDDPDISYDLSMDQYIPSWPTPPAKPLEWYYEIQDRRREESEVFIWRHRNPHALYARNDYEVTFGWIVAHLVEHDSYHGGQAVMLHEMWKRVSKS